MTIKVDGNRENNAAEQDKSYISAQQAAAMAGSVISPVKIEDKSDSGGIIDTTTVADFLTENTEISPVEIELSESAKKTKAAIVSLSSGLSKNEQKIKKSDITDIGLDAEGKSSPGREISDKYEQYLFGGNLAVLIKKSKDKANKLIRSIMGGDSDADKPATKEIKNK